METIFALATAPGKAGVAVIRISGPDAFAVGLALTSTLPEPGRNGLRRLRDEAGGHLDDALVLTFRGPQSFTGEDVVELHTHGRQSDLRQRLNKKGRADCTAFRSVVIWTYRSTRRLTKCC